MLECQFAGKVSSHGRLCQQLVTKLACCAEHARYITEVAPLQSRSA
jgi:hypothetical protein